MHGHRLCLATISNMSSQSPVALHLVGGKVLISAERLERLYCKLPVLKFLVDGHPLMLTTADHH